MHGQLDMGNSCDAFCLLLVLKWLTGIVPVSVENEAHIIALWGWFSHDVLPVTCCEHGPPSIATVHFLKFSIATDILFN